MAAAGFSLPARAAKTGAIVRAGAGQAGVIGQAAGGAGRAAKGKRAAAGGNKTAAAAAQEKGPIVINSERLSADSSTRTAVFSGMVEATNNHMWLYADKMVVHYGETGGIQTIDATGSVKFIKEDSVVTSAKALYTKTGDNVVFTGKPKLVQTGTVVTGTAITYYVSTGNMEVQKSRVFIQQGK